MDSSNHRSGLDEPQLSISDAAAGLDFWGNSHGALNILRSLHLSLSVCMFVETTVRKRSDMAEEDDEEGRRSIFNSSSNGYKLSV